MTRPHDDTITIERLERALVTMAYIVVRHGAVYAPILDRLEREIEDRRRQAEPVERARRLLEAYTRAPAAQPLSLPARNP
jgi:hypothetical protein